MLPPASGDGVVVVTGASSGIGEEIAREFARRGYRLVLVARRADRLRVLAEELGGRAHVLPVDLSNRDDRATLFDQVAALGSRYPGNPVFQRFLRETPGAAR